jgi:hypothetical protein
VWLTIFLDQHFTCALRCRCSRGKKKKIICLPSFFVSFCCSLKAFVSRHIFKMIEFEWVPKNPTEGKPERTATYIVASSSLFPMFVLNLGHSTCWKWLNRVRYLMSQGNHIDNGTRDLFTVNGCFITQDEHLATSDSTNHQSGTLIRSALIGIIYRSTAARRLAVGSVTGRRWFFTVR